MDVLSIIHLYHLCHKYYLLVFFYLFTGIKVRKQIHFLPARDWAIIYRNLKPLLRPCGDLGEGRLDFYHRSLSKAVRRK